MELLYAREYMQGETSLGTRLQALYFTNWQHTHANDVRTYAVRSPEYTMQWDWQQVMCMRMANYLFLVSIDCV